MNTFKKLMSTSLAALMLAGCGTMTFAKNYDDIDKDHAAKTEISILSDIGVIKGTSDNEFSPDELVTREQMAAFLFRIMLGRDDAGRVNTTNFTDLYEPYYNGAISWANAAGYILGTSKVTFEPTGGITKQDAMTMVVRALGQDNDKMNDNYPWSYINAAVRLGLDRGLEDVNYDETLTRADTAVILYNALTAEYLIGKTTMNGTPYYESTSIIEEVFGYDMNEAVLVATNDYSIDGEPVVKNDYVTLRCVGDDDKTFYMTVPYAEMNLDGEANEHLGEAFRVIHSQAAGKYAVLSVVPMTDSESYDTAKIDAERDVVEIGGTRYTLVDEYSDELSTNNNELMLFAYDDDGSLEVIEDIDELADLLGFYRITLLCDGGSETAARGLIREFNMGQLETDEDGKVNLAKDKKEDDLTIVNEADARDGDYVLYYYNEETAELHLAEVLDSVRGTVKRLTSTTVRIDDDSYNLGNAAAGISAESIHEMLELGSKVTAIVYKDAVVAVEEGVTVSSASEYLVALSDAQRIYENGNFRYVMTAFVDGERQNIFVRNSEVEAGQVYRYTKSGDEYKLIAAKESGDVIVSGRDEFIQSADGLDEIAYLIDSASNTTIELGGKNYYTMSAGDADSTASVKDLDTVRFVCDKDTVILVNNNGTIMQRTGEYTSTITVNDEAYVAAIFNNEVGSVETLRFLYISNGELGNYDLNAEFVRVLAVNGSVYEDGKAYTEYVVYNFETNEIEIRLSRADDLSIGEDYRCGSDDTITTETSDHVMSGFVTGYTSGTVSVDGATYTHAAGMKVVRIVKDKNGSYKAEAVKLADLYMKHVEFISDKGEVTFILEGAAPTFTAAAEDQKVSITPDFDIDNFKDSQLTLVSMTTTDEEQNVDITEATIAFGEGVIEVELPETVESGDYTINFKIGSMNFSVELSYTKAE